MGLFAFFKTVLEFIANREKLSTCALHKGQICRHLPTSLSGSAHRAADEHRGRTAWTAHIAMVSPGSQIFISSLDSFYLCWMFTIGMCY